MVRSIFNILFLIIALISNAVGQSNKKSIKIGLIAAPQYAVLELSDDRLIITGFGRMISREFICGHN